MFEGLVRNGLVVTVATLIVTVLGLAAALRIPVQMIPDLEVRTITVRTDKAARELGYQPVIDWAGGFESIK